MKVLIVTGSDGIAKNQQAVKDALISAGYDVEEKSINLNKPFDGCSYDFIVVDEYSKIQEENDIGWFGVITEITDMADSSDRNSVILGKKYPLYLDAQGAVCFTDEQGERNYGCDSEEDSVYKFYRIQSLTMSKPVDRMGRH